MSDKRVIFLVLFVASIVVLFGLVFSPLGLTQSLIAPPPQTSQSSTPATPTPSVTSDPCDVPDRTMHDDAPNTINCAAYGLSRRAVPARIHYGVMVGYETDVVEIVMHEIYPVVDSIVVVETNVTHSRKDKPFIFNATFHERLVRFRDKIHYVPIPRKEKFSDNWAIEKFQRNSVMRLMMTELRAKIKLKKGDIIVGNIDMDELMNRRTLAKWKYCEMPQSKPLYFHLLQCQWSFRCSPYTHLAGYGGTVFYFDGTMRDFYRSRSMLRSKIELGSFSDKTWKQPAVKEMDWHMSSFGSVDEVLRKNDNSPHRHISVYTREQVLKAFEVCHMEGRDGYRTFVPLPLLPVFVRQNECYFRKKRWI